MRFSVKYRVLIHILVWGLLTILPFLIFSNAANGYSIGVIPGNLALIMGMIHIALFYTQALYLYPRFFNRRWWWLYIPGSLALICLSIWLKFYIAEIGWPKVLTEKHESYKLIIGGSIDMYFISLVYCRIVYRIRYEREMKEQQAAQLATELKFLRSQISPHFLFNVLTNFVSLARKKSDKLESSLIMLAELMRYMLYDTQDKKVALSTEIRYLNSYIELQTLRFGNDVQIDSQIEKKAEETSFTIEPMLLIPFVENAFKHSVGTREQPKIGIHLSVKEGWMNFEVRNTFDETVTAGKEENSGLGLNNVRTRLGLLYPNNHTLSIRKEGNWFHIVLTLKLI